MHTLMPHYFPITSNTNSAYFIDMPEKPNWKQLEDTIKACHQCEGLNSEELGTQNATGYGNKASEIVFIGQSLCGKPCIEAQIPFTGGSGKLLDQAFERASIQKKDIYITNVVKCHPVDNRKSYEHEIANCNHYLKQELEWIKPKVIVCLGKDAWGFFNTTISSPGSKDIKLNGQIATIHFVYHPSYVMKKPKLHREKYINHISGIINSARIGYG